MENLLNKRVEIVSKFRHEIKFYVKKSFHQKNEANATAYTTVERNVYKQSLMTLANWALFFFFFYYK